MNAKINTAKGSMTVELYDEATPNTVANFVKLAEEGFYDGLSFHRVIPSFMVQGGCPNSRAGSDGMPGTGGPGYHIDCEVEKERQHHERGVLSMAHAGATLVARSSLFAIVATTRLISMATIPALGS